MEYNANAMEIDNSSILSEANQIISGAKNIIDKAIGGVEGMLSANDGKGVAHWSAFILCSCIIDYLASYRYTGIVEGTGNKYRKYIRDYLCQVNCNYDAEGLYNHLRCGMVHGFTDLFEGEAKFYFTHINNFPHLQPIKTELGVRVLMDVNAFLGDIKKSSDLLFDETKTSGEILASMKKRNKEVGIVRNDISFEFRLADIHNSK